MRQNLNPSYSALANQNKEKITLVRHLPDLPVASSLYANEVFYRQSDTCFYRCIQVDKSWMWERVTYGLQRRYILSVKTLTPEETYDNCYTALMSIVDELYSKYDVVIEGMEDPGNGYYQEAAIALYNRLVDHVNKVCIYHEDEKLPHTSADEQGPTAEGFIQDFVNPLIDVVNPHADVSTVLNDLLRRVSALERRVNS